MLGVNERFDFTAPRVATAALGRTHFIAIGGSGMSAVAALLAEDGVVVDGCDAAESPTAVALRERGIPVHLGHDPSHLGGVDTVVVSSAIPESNPELAAARAGGTRVLHRAQALASAMAQNTRVIIAGANGKTTTTAMVVAALRAAGRDPSFAVGSELVDLEVSAHRGSGPDFVAEADESDGSFLAYGPDVAIVTNVQPDHLDFYGDFAHVEGGYAAFADSIGPDGLLVVAADDPGAARLAARSRAAGRRVLTYGEDPASDVRIEEVSLDGMTSTALVTQRATGRSVPLRVNAPGRHNLHNAAAALTACWAGLGIDPAALAEGLAGFAGTSRRFQTRGEAGGVKVVDDYAHNPAKVAAVVAAGRGVLTPGSRLVVVFQPHLFSRTRDFAAEFAAGLSGSDHVVLMPIYGAREQPMPGVGSALIADLIDRPGTGVELANDPGDAIAKVLRVARPGDLVLTVGAGDVTRLAPLLLTALAEGDPR